DIRTYVYKGLGFFDAPEVQDLQALLRVLAQPDSDLRAAEFLRSRFVRISDIALTRLAPRFSDALLLPDLPALDALDEPDRRLIDLARRDLARWLEQADRLPPSELVDTVLADAAYAAEMRGRRLDQARENVKKVRSLIRRVESRGYATIGRIAEYFETLRAGDESHAILEASGCVNLMTMHAAKGLEFPIVFLVNLQMPGRGRGGGFSVIEHGPDGRPEVAFTSTEATKLEDEREAEELRRLLYVGVTRARDRLYLAGQIDARGELRRGPRSLASLLPSSMTALFREAAAGTDGNEKADVTWTVAGGSYTFAVCRPTRPTARSAAAVPTGVVDIDTEMLGSGGRRPVSAAATGPQVMPQSADADARGHRLVGTIVHRLFQHRVDTDWEPSRVEQWLASVVSVEERIDIAVEDWVGTWTAAFERYRRLRRTPEVDQLLASGDCLFEVPFSYVQEDRPGEVLRGVIDGVVIPRHGPVTVIEFKTGIPRPGHTDQVAQYQAAIRVILGKKDVGVKILSA